MIKIKTIVLSLFLCMTATNVMAQTPYIISKDEQTGSLIYKGSINKYTLMNDSSFSWYLHSLEDYKPDTSMLGELERSKSKLNFIVFGGTWCDDSQYIMPRFFRLIERAGISDSAVCLFGVDRNKQTISNLSASFAITRVPTIIVMKEGKEVGRVVEYGTTGKWDKELVDLIIRN